MHVHADTYYLGLYCSSQELEPEIIYIIYKALFRFPCRRNWNAQVQKASYDDDNHLHEN